ncbi:thiamine-phosphate pyrophosphorylase [Nitratifractor sp.]|uniref:thiamine-phosphate pyrophosphorylase n=1 Tax=Nitratifractor sp. TaxID=2268144 RepID=UPI0025EC5107|nr:thiamine-phosphate pyrophosphorylase [Nitratifractor sp.]
MSDPTRRLQRLIDANLNRLREGLRVLEDIQRYLFDNEETALRFKHLRHSLQKAYDPSRLIHRDIQGDVLKESTKSEMKRTDIRDLMIANFSRAQESARVLEEAFKIEGQGLSSLFKNVRYELYALEKDLLGRPEKKSSSNSR